MEKTHCICGKKLGKLANGKPAKTCNKEGHHRCAGRIAKAHMQEVRECKQGDTIAPREYTPYHGY